MSAEFGVIHKDHPDFDSKFLREGFDLKFLTKLYIERTEPYKSLIQEFVWFCWKSMVKNQKFSPTSFLDKPLTNKTNDEEKIKSCCEAKFLQKPFSLIVYLSKVKYCVVINFIKQLSLTPSRF